MRSTSGTTFSDGPLSQSIIMSPISSTPVTVPCVPMGGAAGSSIRMSSILVLIGYRSRRACSCSFLIISLDLLLWRSVPPRTVPRKVLEQNPARSLELITDEAEPDQKYPEGELLIIRIPLRRTDAFLFLAHPADGGNKLGVCFCFIRFGHLRKPRE